MNAKKEKLRCAENIDLMLVYNLGLILGQAVTVGVTMFVLSISELSEVGMVQHTNIYQIYLKYYVEVLISQQILHFYLQHLSPCFVRLHSLYNNIRPHGSYKWEVFKVQNKIMVITLVKTPRPPEVW